MKVIIEVGDQEIRKIVREEVERALNGNGEEPVSQGPRFVAAQEQIETKPKKAPEKGKKIHGRTLGLMHKIRDIYKDGAPLNWPEYRERLGRKTMNPEERRRLRDLTIELGYKPPPEPTRGRPPKEKYTGQVPISINLNEAIESKLEEERAVEAEEEKETTIPNEIDDDNEREILRRFWCDGSEAEQISAEIFMPAKDIERLVEGEKSIQYARINTHMMSPKRKKLLEET